MGYPGPSKIFVAKSLTVNTSLITTPPIFTGDFQQITVSFSTQSNNAINVQQSNEDGLQSVIPEASWRNVFSASINSIHVLPVGARWSRTSSPASSNATIIFTGRA